MYTSNTTFSLYANYLLRFVSDDTIEIVSTLLYQLNTIMTYIKMLKPRRLLETSCMNVLCRVAAKTSKCENRTRIQRREKETCKVRIFMTG